MLTAFIEDEDADGGLNPLPSDRCGLLPGDYGAVRIVTVSLEVRGVGDGVQGPRGDFPPGVP